MKTNDTLTLARELEIIALAERLAAPFTGRVDLEEIATAAGIAFCYASFPQDFDGLLLLEQGKFVLVCNERRHKRGSPRSRFTFAHELGHYFLREHRQAIQGGLLAARIPRRGPWGERILEQECDTFAANLLLPEPSFRRLANNLTGLAQIQSLTDTFGTSLTSTAYRALELDLFRAPAAVLLWDQLGQPAGRRVSEATLFLDGDYTTLATTPPARSVTAAAIADLRWGIHSGESHVMDWFTGLDGYEPEHQIQLREEVMALGNYGWITLIQALE